MIAAKSVYEIRAPRIKLSVVLIFLAVFATGFISSQPWLEWADQYPSSWIVPFSKYLSTAIKWLVNDADFGLFTFKEFTRAIGSVLDVPTLFLNRLQDRE